MSLCDGAGESCWPFFLVLGMFAAFAGDSYLVSLLASARAATSHQGEKVAAGLPQSKTLSRVILPGMSLGKGRTSMAKMS
jgi:hypothetical protein